ncbi:MAG: peptidase S8 [Ignavibacteriaceae bacterium]|nr:peptidase S8 [Ignavibacteriaceae bacterium]
MRFNSFLFFLIFLLTVNISSQTKSVYLKYKSSLSKYEVLERLSKKEILTKSSNSFLKTVEVNAKPLADDLTWGVEELSRIIKLTFNSVEQLENFISSAEGDPAIEYLQKENIYKIDFTPNDSLISEQWALEKINAFEAWNISQGSDSVIICIIDTGIDFEHKDLSSKIFYNPGEIGLDRFGADKRINNYDDDNNGFVDDYMGWDFTDRVGFPFDSTGGDYLEWDNNPKDENNHGTYIAGIIGASTNNKYGIAGIAPKCKLLNLRAFDPNGFGEEDDVAAAILYAVKMGAKVINMSFGDNAFSYVLRDIINYAYSKGVVLVASSGNSGSSEPHYPSGYSEVLCVGNSTEEDYVSSNSNFGSTIDLVAPGSLILTTARDNDYGLVSGTSASAPFISGAAALILSLENFSNEEIKQILKSTADDIEKSGWDLKSGAGRLNLFKSLNIIAPSKVMFNYPTQDAATSSNSLSVNATILSAYFLKYELYYGVGLNPSNWVQLIDNGLSQVDQQIIYSLDIATLSDTVYTLRLIVFQNNGKTLEERVNFHIDRTAPLGNLIAAAPAFYGNKMTILAAVESNEPTIVRMYYRKLGESYFNFVTLDGFASNSQFVKRLHYGFIPKHLVEQNVLYQIYFELENLVGLKNTIQLTNDSIFSVSTESIMNLSSETEMPYSLNKGSIFHKPTNFISQDYTEVLFNEFYPSDDLYYSLYKLNGNHFLKIDSIKNKLPRDVGDFNKNGKVDLLSSIQRDGFLDEQSFPNSFSLNNKYSNSSGSFWPILAADIDFNGTTEILVVDSDTSLTVWDVTSDLGIVNPRKLNNFTPKSFAANLINSPNVTITDTDKNGKNEIWIVDRDGDVFSYEIQSPNNFIQHKVFSTGFLGSSALISSGDYTGDGVPEIGVLIHSIDDLDIAPFYRLLVFNFIGDRLNIIFDQAFIDASVEFNTSFRQSETSLKFANIDSDNEDEIIAFVFPFSYIFDYSSAQNSVISFKENVNSNSIFVGDLNKNGINEVAFPTNEGIKFYEFASSNSATTPNNVTGYSIDSEKVFLKWIGTESKFYIFRGNDAASINLIDSTSSTFYVDSIVDNETYYFYSIRSYDASKQIPFSDLSLPIKIFTHAPANLDTVFLATKRSISVKFSEKISNTIDNLNSFFLSDVGIPHSISPLDEKSLLLSFENDLTNGAHYLVVKDLRDFYGSPIQNDTIEFIINYTNETALQFFITSHEIISPYKLKIKFNIEVDEESASSPANYIFDPHIDINSAVVDPSDKKIVYLSWNQKPVGSIGLEYTLHVSNVLSSSATGKWPIATGSGSYIVLTGYVKDLSDVYIYPQPVILSDENSKVTFANLPDKANIIIMNLNGEKVAFLEEKDGDGGVDYFLRDNDNQLLSSGIYLYRIVRLDSSGNEVEEKLGKFAVIR